MSAVHEGGSIFNEGQTYQSYLNCVHKACFAPRYPADWYTPRRDLRRKGLAHGWETKDSITSFNRIEIALRIIRLGGESSEFVNLAYLAFSLLLACLLGLYWRNGLIRRICGIIRPQMRKDLFPFRRSPAGKAHVVKLSYRKHMPGGCILRRPFSCTSGSKNARKLCPSHRCFLGSPPILGRGTIIPLFQLSKYYSHFTGCSYGTNCAFLCAAIPPPPTPPRPADFASGRLRS